MTAEQWAAVAGKAQGEKRALIDVIEMAVETLKVYNDPKFATIILESILLAVEARNVANDNKPEPEADFALWADGRITTKRN